MKPAHFFIFPHHAIFKQFSLIHKTIIINAFFTKMVSKCVSISVCWKNGFNLRICYLKYTETSTPHISKCEFSQPGGTGVDVTQKQKSRIDQKFGTDMKKDIFYRIMKPFFEFWFQIWITQQNYLIGRLATIKKSGFMILCGMSICIYPQNMSKWALTVIKLERHPCLANQRPCMFTLATRWK